MTHEIIWAIGFIIILVLSFIGGQRLGYKFSLGMIWMTLIQHYSKLL